MKFICSLFIIIIGLTTVSYSQSIQDGKKFYYYERFESAENVFHLTLQQDPSNAEAWSWLVRTYQQQNNLKAAEDSLGKAPSAISEEPFYLIAKATLLLNTNREAEAKATFQKVVEETKSKNVSVLSAIAAIQTESEKGDLPYAIDLLQTAIRRDKKDAELYVILGKAHRKLHDGTAAYQAFKEAIDKDKNAAPAYYELGRIFVTQKNADVYNDYFTKAVEADKQFSPAYYALYTYSLYSNPAKANEYFSQYMSNADPSLQQAYDHTDLLYLNKKYDSAIVAASRLILSEGDSVQSRLYKLIGYSYLEKKDSSNALNYMREYLLKGVDSNFIAKDFETTAALYGSIAGKEDTAMYFLETAVTMSNDPGIKINYYRQLAAYANKAGNNEAEAKWLGKIYENDPTANNVTLFNWGLAAYKAQDFLQADSVFGIYTAKYPEQGFGYYWRARSNAAIDTAMEKGLAVPHYLKLLEVINKDSASATDKKWMKESYGYLAGYEANTEKDYKEAIGYFEKLLELDPANEQAKRNIKILEKNLDLRNKNEAGGSN